MSLVLSLSLIHLTDVHAEPPPSSPDQGAPNTAKVQANAQVNAPVKTQVKTQAKTQTKTERSTPTAEMLSRPQERAPWDPNVRRGVLPNKMRYLIEANEHPAGRAELRLVVDAGSVLEDDDQLGLAHFVEHMAFNGSTHFKGNELINTLESFGMKFGAHLNAYTSFDETVYKLQIPTEPEKLQVALQILRDWAGGISFNPEEIERERGVVLEEWRRRLGASKRLRDQLIPFLFNHSRYAARLPIGTEASLKRFKPEQLTRFYRDWYRPELMTLIAVGDFDVDQLEIEIKRRFSDLKNPPQARVRTRPAIKTYHDKAAEIFIDPELKNSVVSISELKSKRESVTRAEYRTSLINSLATSILNERFNDLRKRGNPPLMYAIIRQSRLTASVVSQQLLVIPFEGKLKEAINASILELKRVQMYGATQAELDRMKRVFLSKLDRWVKEERTEKSEKAAAELVRHVTRGESVLGIKAEFALKSEIMSTINVSDVNSALRDILSGEGWCAMLTGSNQSASWFPDKEGWDAMIKAAFQLKPERVEHAQTDQSPLVPKPPTGGALKREVFDSSTGATIWELSNGVKVVVKPTDFDDNEILIKGFKWGGTSTVSDADYIPATQAGSLAMSSGLGAWSSTSLPKRLAGIQAGVSLGISELEVWLSGRSTVRDLDVMFELLWLRATSARIDEEPFNIAQRIRRDKLRSRTLDPSTVFYDAYKRLNWDNHPRRQPMTDAVLTQANLERSRQLLRELTQDWSGATFIIVGKVDLDHLKPKVVRWLGGLPVKRSSPTEATSVQAQRGFKDVGARFTRTAHRQVIRSGLEPKAQVILRLNGDLENAPYHRYMLRSLTQVLSIRLREVIREREGGTYSVNAKVLIIERPLPEYAIEISFGCDPKRVEELTQITRGEWVRLRESGVREEEVNKVAASQLRDHEIKMKLNREWLDSLSSNAYRDEPSSALIEYWSFHHKLTSEQLNEAAKRYLKDSPHIQLTLLPQATDEEKAERGD